MKINKFIAKAKDRCLETIRAYPLSLLIIATVFGLLTYFNWATYSRDLFDSIYKVVLPLIVVLPLFTSVNLLKMRKWVFLLAGALGLGMYWLIHDVGMEYAELPGKIALWGLAFYLMLFALPQWKKNNNLGLWQYTKHMVFILALGLASAVILSGSLSVALFSVENLFDVSVDERWYSSVWIFGMTFFLPVLVHAMLPNKWESFNKDRDFPTFMRPFSYYLLLPICILYFGILTAYVLKIVVSGVWPAGEVAYPVLYFSLLFFAFYFISAPWRKVWDKWGFAALAPFLLVYLFALYQRVEQYGLTEMRYLGFALGFVLLGSAIYFLFSKKQRFQTFVVAVAGIAFLSIIGPWNIFDVAVSSQKDRLENLLAENGLLVDGKLVRAEGVDLELQTAVSESVLFLNNHDAMEEVAPWTNLDPTDYVSLNASDFMGEMGMEFDTWGKGYVDDGEFVQLSRKWSVPLSSKGCDLLFEVSTNYFENTDTPDQEGSSFTWDEHVLVLSIDENGIISIGYDSSDEILLDALGLYERAGTEGLDFDMLAPEDMLLVGENEDIAVRLYVQNFNGHLEEDGVFSYAYASGSLLIDLK